MSEQKTLADVIRKIVQDHGEKALLDSQFTLAVFMDLAPTLKKERELLRAFLLCDGAKKVLDSRGLSSSERDGRISALIQQIANDHWVAESAAKLICDEFYYGVTGAKLVVPVATPKESVSLPKPEPKKEENVKSSPPDTQTQQYTSNNYSNSINWSKVIWIAIGIIAAILLLRSCFGSANKKEKIEILTSDFTITVGETAEVCVNSTTSNLKAKFNNCIGTGWIDIKASGGKYYLSVLGVAPGTCTLRIQSEENENVYDTITITVVGDADVNLNESDTTVPIVNSLEVPAIADNHIAITPYEEKEHSVETATFSNYTGSITDAAQSTDYSITAPTSGTYRFETKNLVSGFTLSMYIFDSSGSRINYSTNLGNGEGMTADLKAGETYKLQVKRSSGTGNYEIVVGHPKETLDVSGYTQINDATEFRGQQNIYTYTPVQTGKHRIEIANLNAGVQVSIYIYDSAGYRVDYNTGISQKGGITATLEAGKTYTINVKQSSGCGSYTMNIGPQKATSDITGVTSLQDSIKFYGQENNYTITASHSGKYRFQIEQINSGIELSLYVYDSAGYRIDYSAGIGQDSGLTVSLEEGQKYNLVVKQSSSTGDYVLSVGAQKAYQDISSYDTVIDSIQFVGQRNIYYYKPSNSGSYSFTVSGLANNAEVSLYIIDDAGYTIDYRTGIDDNGKVTVSLDAAKNYTIEIRQSSYTSSYQLMMIENE